MASKVTLNGELMFPNEYLNAVEFKGRDVGLVISSVTSEMLKAKTGKDKRALVMRFNGTNKKFVCNKTNADTIASLYGAKAEGWIGKKVTLYPTRCLAFGEQVDCIRIRMNGQPARSEHRNDEPAADSFSGEPTDDAFSQPHDSSPRNPADREQPSSDDVPPGGAGEETQVDEFLEWKTSCCDALKSRGKSNAYFASGWLRMLKEKKLKSSEERKLTQADKDEILKACVEGSGCFA